VTRTIGYATADSLGFKVGAETRAKKIAMPEPKAKNPAPAKVKGHTQSAGVYVERTAPTPSQMGEQKPAMETEAGTGTEVVATPPEPPPPESFSERAVPPAPAVPQIISAPLRWAADGGLPFLPFQAIEVPDEEQRWLVRDVWGLGAVGIIGGDPKLGKTISTDELAVSVASGSPFLGRFEVARPGPVVICSMEGQPWLTTDRLTKICRFRGVDPKGLKIYVLDRATLRLDNPADLNNLRDALIRLDARLLILDPFVRLHGADENSAADVSRVLGGLQTLQRETSTSIAVVHHNKKNVPKNARPGSGLRGSTDLHAWGDTNWYLRSNAGVVTLTIEHRAAPSPEPLRLRLIGTGDTLGFDLSESALVADDAGAKDATLRDRVLEVLRLADVAGVGFGAIRATLAANAKKVSVALHELQADGLVEKCGRGWALRSVPPVPPVPPEGAPEPNPAEAPRSVPRPPPISSPERNGGGDSRSVLQAVLGTTPARNEVASEASATGFAPPIVASATCAAPPPPGSAAPVTGGTPSIDQPEAAQVTADEAKLAEGSAPFTSAPDPETPAPPAFLQLYERGLLGHDEVIGIAAWSREPVNAEALARAVETAEKLVARVSKGSMGEETRAALRTRMDSGVRHLLGVQATSTHEEESTQAGSGLSTPEP
jgi:hypothetical protein